MAAIVELAANVSTNRVYLVRLADGSNVFAKVSNYGSPFLFREDHERILRLIKVFRNDRWEGFLAAPLTTTSDGRIQAMTYFDGAVWRVIYSVASAETAVAQRAPQAVEHAGWGARGRRRPKDTLRNTALRIRKAQ